jgi:hypothetical protein
MINNSVKKIFFQSSFQHFIYHDRRYRDEIVDQLLAHYIPGQCVQYVNIPYYSKNALIRVAGPVHGFVLDKYSRLLVAIRYLPHSNNSCLQK